MQKVTDQIKEQFENNAKSVRGLLKFDELILEVSIAQLREVNNKLKNIHEIDNPLLLVDNAIKALENIKKHESLKAQYETMYNQCLVLLVSYFTSAVTDLFIKAVQYSADNGIELKCSKEDFKFSFKELTDYKFDLKGIVGELIVTKNQISFQDMQSSCRAFKKYLSVEIEQNTDINNIILSQACRHAIVHASSVVNEKCIKQIRDANPRDLKEKLEDGDEITFSVEEIGKVIGSMTNFINMVSNKLNKNLT